jgi:DNA ligase-3
MFAEVKYDGERVQIHKQGDEFQYFSRNLKSVLPHKTEDFAEYLPQALPCDSVILDGEILLAEAGTGEPLPFGTLGVRKKLQHEGATVCLFIFDILYYGTHCGTNNPGLLQPRSL